MKAMILAAGRGERLRPLTDRVPKPLLPVVSRPLIEYTVESLVAAGVCEIIINLAWLGELIEKALGDGRRFGAVIRYSYEGRIGLETAGGIVHALGLLGDEPFLVVNGDIVTDFPFQRLRDQPADLAHLVLVPNPPHNENGDFSISRGRVAAAHEHSLTFSGFGVKNSSLVVYGILFSLGLILAGGYIWGIGDYSLLVMLAGLFIMFWFVYYSMEGKWKHSTRFDLFLDAYFLSVALMVLAIDSARRFLA